MFVLVKVFLDVHVKIVFVVPSTILHNNWTFFGFKKTTLHIHVARSTGQCTYSICKVSSMSWFTHFAMRIAGRAQLLSHSHLMGCASISLIFLVNGLVEGLF